MTFDRNRHEPWDELVSASLSGDLTDDERRRLDGHLDRCADCRATLAAFADQRRIMSGLRHIAPPRDLGARVRTGIETSRVPWWRRPPAIFAGVGGGLAVVAGALLALVVLGDEPQDPNVGGLSPAPSVSVGVAPSAGTSFAPPPSPTPILSPGTSVAAETPVPSVADATPLPPSTTPQPSPEPEAYMALVGPVQSPTLTVLEGTTDAEVAQIETPEGDAVGPPVAAELSPDGQWIGYISEGSGSGINELSAVRISEGVVATDPDTGEPEPSASPPLASTVPVGDTVVIGQSVGSSPFLDRMSWSPDGRYLAVTLADATTDEIDADVWILDTADGTVQRLTDTGTAFAGSFIPATDDGTARLWVSTAGDEPRSHIVDIPDAEEIVPGDPAVIGASEVAGFQPLLSPNGELVIYWTGRMSQQGDGNWAMLEGGQPILTEVAVADDGTISFDAERERPVFGDITVERDAFTWASIVWAPDGDAFAVWDARWTGLPQSGDADYPAEDRVYFGHASDARGITVGHAIDQGDIPDDSIVEDVKVSPTGRHLAITARRPQGGTMEAPTADLILVKRNTGDVSDEVRELRSGEDGWFGPAVFDRGDWEELVQP